MAVRAPKDLAKKPVLTQQMIHDYLQLEANYKLVTARYEQEKEELIKLFEDNPHLDIENGLMTGKLKKTPQQRAAWKEEFIKECGQAKADEVQKAAPVTYRRVLEFKMKADIEV